MVDALYHRGPDGRGVWVDDEAGIGLGSRRLAVIDLTSTGGQPMISASGRHVVVFNGEIYNFAELRAMLQGDYPFRGTSDTEVLLAAVARWGLVPALRRANGMFAFALWDKTARTLTLGRDRLGEKPLYYAWMGTTLLFGSELKALRVHPLFTAEIDNQALALYFRHGYVPAPLSIHRRVYKLPPGTVLSVPDGTQSDTVVPVPYWSAREVAEAGLREPLVSARIDAVDAVEELLRDSIRLRMVADVPIGAFLSGGVDSSTVVALMQAEHGRGVRTFTVGFAEADYDEAPWARAVARHLGTEHEELRVTPGDALDVIPRLSSIFDEPFADSSQIPTLLVARLARQRVTVGVSGDGGDELFGGYNRYVAVSGLRRRLQWLPVAVRRAAAAALTAVPPGAWDRLLGGRRWLPDVARQTLLGEKVHKFARILPAAPEDVYVALMSMWDQPELLLVGRSRARTPLIDALASMPDADLVDRLLWADSVTYLPDDLLTKVDRTSMSVSLETRLPLLDHRLFEHAWRLPNSLKIRRGVGKWILRQVLRRHLPAALVDRPKMGFAVPVGDWVRGPLREWAEELLTERRLVSDGYLQPAPVRRTWSEHLSGRQNAGHKLWAVLMFQAWLGDR